MRGEAFVAGVGLHPFGRFPELDYRDLGEYAMGQALQDAGITFPDVEIAFVGNVLAEMAKASNVLARHGLTGIPIISVENACASGGSAFKLAAEMVAAGVHDVALALGVEKAPKGFIADCGYERWQINTGLGVNPVYFALFARDYLHRHGATEEDLALVSVKNHRHAVDNPNAMYRKEVTVEQVLESPMVCDPLRLLMLCAPNEGAAAAVIMSRAAVERYRIEQPIRIRAAAVASRVPEHLFVPAASASTVTGSGSSAVARAAERAYEEAGIGPEDIDFAEVQDTDAASELIACEQLGLVKEGEAVIELRAGVTALGGRRPINPSGGLLSKGEPLGASAIGQVAELVTQLRGQAGPRQVEGVRTGLAQTIGAGGNCSVVILSN